MINRNVQPVFSLNGAFLGCYNILKGGVKYDGYCQEGGVFCDGGAE